MNKYFLIIILLISLVFQNCKNDKKTQDDKTKIKTEAVDQQQIDSIITIENKSADNESSDEPQIDENEEKINNISKPSSVATKIITLDPVEKTIETVSEKTNETEVLKETINEIEQEEEVVEEVIVKETEEKIETVTETVVETENKPIVEEPKIVTSPTEWIVPAKYKKMKNPTDPKVDLAIGKSLYSKHCKSCHGKEGYGDGTKADEVEGDLGDFSSKEFQTQTDGELFYKSYIGRDDMPNYEKKIPHEEDVWLIVNYMRTLAK